MPLVPILAKNLLIQAFTVAREIFVIPHLLLPEILEKTVLEVFYRFYDTATNGNRTRGDMKLAFQTLQVLNDPANTPSISHAVKLVGATHALSNYSISLTPGISLNPAQIRTTNDPALLISKVIETNSPVYRDGERMLRILHDLIEGTQLFAHRTPQEAGLETTRMEARVNATIVKAALAENDFNTAYDTCVKKLVPVTGVGADVKNAEIAWVVFLQTATFSGRPQTRRPARMTQTTLDNEKMELLAHALIICPKEEMDGIVSRWTNLENKLLWPEAQQPEIVSAAPQTRGSGDYHRGFFETAAQVGRSVARTASPMLGGETFEGRRSGEMEGLGEFGAVNPVNWRSSSSRFGVRDMVKSGLTQGIGWLLGASPTHEDEEK
jgi:protein transport protein SEC39